MRMTAMVVVVVMVVVGKWDVRFCVAGFAKRMGWVRIMYLYKRYHWIEVWLII